MKQIIIVLLFISNIFSNNEVITIIDNNVYNTITLSIHNINNINNNIFNTFYNYKNGLGIKLKSPFYIGKIQASLEFNKYLGKNKNYIDFIGIFPNITWGYDIKISPKFTWYNSIGLGNYIFYFNNPLYESNETFDPSIFESELSFCLDSEFSYKIYNFYNLNLSIQHAKIFTFKRINITNLSIGISRNFNTPEWIKLILK